MSGLAELIQAHEARLKVLNTGLPVHLIVRTAVPWESMNKALLCAQDDWLLTPMAKHTHLIQSWESAYGLNYCEYRAAVREACNAVNMRAPWNSVSRGLNNVQWGYGDEILVCIDDDDTFEPELVSALKAAFVDGVNIVRWPRRMNVLGYVQPDTMYSTTYLDTCNWAVRKSFLNYWGWEAALKFLAYHWVAHQMTAKRFMTHSSTPKKVFGMLPQTRVPSARLSHNSIVELDKAYSTYYVHTGSISYLDSKHGSHSGNELARFLKGKPLHPLYNV